MKKIELSGPFSKSLKKIARQKPDVIAKVIDKILLFENDKSDPSLYLHKLSGVLKEHWAFSIEYNLRIVFRYKEDGSILFTDIGTHDEVY